eukprot:TRINITY_DN8613_c0_g1_i1.p1 TRINITY_DN8613_c0_g1~~TRINITY_DN8613_c0_g1_i1.p1  ORF type:complete len:537 (-),score=105.34 TRINITY_DN8613_c0_g1_i1:189-1799(-)
MCAQELTMRPDQRQAANWQATDLRAKLMLDLHAAGVEDLEGEVVRQEVDRFLEHGRYSATNVDRLIRRVRGRATSSYRSCSTGSSVTPRSARPRSCSASLCSKSPSSRGSSGAYSRGWKVGASNARDTWSDYESRHSVSSRRHGDDCVRNAAPRSSSSRSGWSCPQSARSSSGPCSTHGRVEEQHRLTTPCRPGTARAEGSVEGSITTWSEVAKYAKRVEELEKRRTKDELRKRQVDIRQELLRQMEQKKERQCQAKEQEVSEFSRYKVEQERLEDIENARKMEYKQKVLKVAAERSEQVSHAQEARERELREKQAEDRHRVKVACRELEAEQRRAMHSKAKRQAALASMADETAARRFSEEEARRERYAQERKNVREYYTILELEEQRNRIQVLSPRGGEANEFPVWPALKRDEGYYSEDSIARQLDDMMRAKDAAERERDQMQRMARKTNQDFLASQIAERDYKRREAAVHKGEQREEAKAASNAHNEAERARVVEQRKRNEDYRRELQQQMGARKAATKENMNSLDDGAALLH